MSQKPTNRKWIILSILSFATIAYGHAQEDPCLTNKDPLEPRAFSKMLTNQFSYAIIGKEAPVSGFKFESAKPTITLNGNIYTKKGFIANLSLSGGLSEGNIGTLFSGKKLDGAFKASAGLNFLIPRHNGKYNFEKIGDKLFKDLHSLAQQQQQIEEGSDSSLKAAFRVMICNNRENIAKRIDTASILIALIEAKKLPGSLIEFAPLVAHEFHKLLINGFDRPAPTITVIDSILKNYLVKPRSVESSVYAVIEPPINQKSYTGIKMEELLSDYSRLKAIKKDDYENLQLDYQITKLKDIWVKTTTMWVNVTPSISNATLTLLDMTTKHLKDSNTTLPGIELSWNWYSKMKGPRYTYIKIGAAVIKSNNLDELEKTDYRTSTRQASPTDSLFEEKTGTAYKGMINHGTEFALFAETYFIPWKLPFGFYIASKYRSADNWINKKKLSLNLGLVWNVNNTADEKNVLSIVPYVSWSNLLPDYKDAGKINQNKVADLFSVNIKFGVPINVLK